MALPKVGVEAVIEGMAKFEADSKKVNKSLDNMGTSTRNLGSIASGVTSKITSLAGSLLKIGAVGAGVAIAGIGAGLYTAASAGLSFNNTMEQARAKINAFTKDAGLTDKILEDVRLEAAKTPFEFDEMADAVSGLLPAAKQADVGIMDLLADAEVLAASKPAEGLAGATFALREAVSGDFTSVIERFDLPRSMINQLKAEGVPALEIVRQAMNNMGYDMDLVTALANTAEGRWSTFKDTLTNLAGTVTQPLFDALSGGLGDVNGWLAANEPLLTTMATLLAGQISEALTTVATKAQEMFTAFQSGGFKGLAGVLGVPPETYDTLVNIVTKVGELITTLAGYGGFGLAGILMVDPVAQAALISFLSNLWTWLQTNIPTAIQTVSDLWNNTLMPGFMQIADAVNAQLLPALQQLFNTFSGGTGGTQTFAELWQNTLLPALAAVGDFVINTLFPAWVKMQVFFVGALATSITALADYWQNYLFPAISMVSQFVTTTVIPALTTLWNWLGPKLATAAQDLATLWTGTLQPALLAVNGFISENIIPLLISLGNLFNAVINKAIRASAGLWQNVLLPALEATGDFLNSVLFPVFQSVSETVNKDVSPALKTLGEEVFPLLQEGLDYVTEAIKDVIGYFDSLADKVNSFQLPPILRPGSPPPMAIAMTDIANAANKASQAIGSMMGNLSSSDLSRFTRAGQSIMQSIAAGVGSRGGTVKDAILSQLGFSAKMFASKESLEDEERAQAKQALFKAFEATYSGILAGTKGKEDFLNVFKEGLFGFDATEFGEALGVAATKVDGFIETIKSQFGPLTTAMKAQAVSIASNFAGLGSSFAEAMQPSIDARQDIIDRIQAFLRSGEDEFKFDFAPHLVGVDSVMLDRVRTQQQLTILVAEQREEQEKILQLQKQQQQLDFLGQQISLIQLIESRGLNPADILGGITLGLQASASDLLSVTGNIVTAMVDQINRDLQIHSPSAVMAGIGQQMMAGLQRGIVSMTPVLNAQLSASVAGPLSPAMAGAMNSNSYSTTNIFNTGGNTISNGMNVAEFEARVLQVIRRNL